MKINLVDDKDSVIQSIIIPPEYDAIVLKVTGETDLTVGYTTFFENFVGTLPRFLETGRREQLTADIRKQEKAAEDIINAEFGGGADLSQTQP